MAQSSSQGWYFSVGGTVVWCWSRDGTGDSGPDLQALGEPAREAWSELQIRLVEERARGSMRCGS